MNMKRIPVCLIAAVLCFVGCKYEAPLTLEHSIPVDASVLGLWEAVPDGDGSITVLQFSETEYLIIMPVSAKGDPIYFRGYPMTIGDVLCVQLQLIGDDTQPVDRLEKDLFDVASYELVNGELVIRTLNSDLVGEGLNDTGSLVNAFLKHKNSKKLFVDPCRFKKKKQAE
jgi:hypothetical protein